MNNIEDNARIIAEEAHKGVFRKWTILKTPYVAHPISIVQKLKTLKNTDEIDYASAYLHDVIEDVAILNNNIEYYSNLILDKCGNEVLNIVLELTDPSAYPEFENKSRNEKREADYKHIKHIGLRAKRIKIVDRLDNLKDYKLMPKKLLTKYIPESYKLYELIKEADIEMAKELFNLLEKIKKEIK